MIQSTKTDFQGLANSINGNGSTDGDRPLTHYHSFFYDLFTVSFPVLFLSLPTSEDLDLRLTYVKCVQWKYPRATGFFFFSVISLITAFRFINVLRYVFKAAYLLFACEPHLFLFWCQSRYRDVWCVSILCVRTNLCSCGFPGGCG